MNISLNETLKLDIFKGFRLIAGSKGLSRMVTRIGLLDHEMINPIRGQFVEGEFALSTLLAAKDQPALIYTSVQYLIDSGASGLGIKDIYYKQLCEDVLELAEANDFPIFMFDNSVYFEDVITEFKEFMDVLTSEENLGKKIGHLLKGHITSERLKNLFENAMGYYSDTYCIVYIRHRHDVAIASKLALKGHQMTKRLSVLFTAVFNGGLFIGLKNNGADRGYVLEQEGFHHEQGFFYGLSGEVKGALAFKGALEEALMNSKIALIEGYNHCDVRQLGVYELLYSMAVEKTQSYRDKHLKPLMTYDQQNNATLLETVIAFVQNQGQIKGTAKALIQHDNTIRYRLTKVRQLLEIEGSDAVLYERLALAIRLYLLNNIKY